MSKSAHSFSVGSSDTTLEMKVANMTFMLERLAQDCAPLQFVRELTQNAIDSIVALGGKHGEIRWDFIFIFGPKVISIILLSIPKWVFIFFMIFVMNKHVSYLP